MDFLMVSNGQSAGGLIGKTIKKDTTKVTCESFS